MTDPHVLKVCHGKPGVMAYFFGLAFIALGATMLLDEPELLAVTGVAVFFIASGIWLLVARSGVIIDRQRARVITWRGLLVPMLEREHELFDEITITRETRSSTGKPIHRRDAYLVRGSSVREDPILLYSGHAYEPSRERALRYARFVDCPVVDDVQE